MATRKTRQGGSDNDAAKAVADSAQKIWLAGLGAFERARAEGPRMFDVLVEQGIDLAGRLQGAAGEALRNVRESAGEASGRLEKLEQAVQERLSRSADRLGLLTRGEVDELSNQVRELTESVREMMAHSAAATTAAGAAAKRRAKPKAGSAKRKAKRGVATAKRSVGRKAPGAARSRKRKAKRAAS